MTTGRAQLQGLLAVPAACLALFLCLPACRPGGGEGRTGDPCGADSDCLSDLCVDSPGGGLCSVVCAVQGDCASHGMFCSVLPGEGDGAGLMRACRGPLGTGQQDDPCSAHEECASGICLEGSCTVPCEGACDADHECREAGGEFYGVQAALDVCVEIIRDGVETLEFPDEEITAPAGRHFDLVARRGTVSFMVFVEGDPGLFYALSGLTAPDGTVLLDDQLRGINMIYPMRGIFTALVPDTDRPEGRIQTGTYAFDVISFDDGGLVVPSRASIRIMVKRRSEGSPAGGTVNLHLFVAQGARAGLDASTAAEDPEVQAAIDRLGYYFTTMAGIEIGSTAYQDIPAEYAAIDSQEEVGRMFALSSMAEGDGLALFLVGSLAGLPGSPGGYAGGIPGPPDIRGTFRSGVAVALSGDDELTADSLCHEAGHYLGLFHTSETYSETHETFHDPISDTPECRLETTEDFSSCPARTNLMFPQRSGARNELTTGQSFVINNNALIK